MHGHHDSHAQPPPARASNELGGVMMLMMRDSPMQTPSMPSPVCGPDLLP